MRWTLLLSVVAHGIVVAAASAWVRAGNLVEISVLQHPNAWIVDVPESDTIESPRPLKNIPRKGKDDLSLLAGRGRIEKGAPALKRMALADFMAQGIPAPQYPVLAQRNGWQGVVEVKISSHGVGRSVVTIERTSGFAVLDEAAYSWASEVAFPGENHFDAIIVPVEFVLTDNR